MLSTGHGESGQIACIRADDGLMALPSPTSTGARRVPTMEAMAIVAFALIAMAVVRPINVGVVVAATITLLASRAVARWQTRRAVRTLTAALGASALLVVVCMVVDRGLGALAATTLILAPLAVAVAAIAVRSRLDTALMRWIGAGLLVAMVGLVGVIWVGSSERPDIDVLNLHVSAAEALASGENPYTEARAPDTGPGALPGDEVVGYPYPPLTMLPYVLSQWLLGDPRWAGVIAVAAALVLVARPWDRLRDRRSGALLAIGVAIALQPALGHVLRHGWTEPLALPLLAGVGLLWRKHPAAAAVLLGLTLGLKQYWIVALPLLVAWSGDFRWKRLGIAGGVAALSLLPAFVAGPGPAWQSLVLDLLSLPSRPDSLGLAGIGWETPFVVVLALVVGAATWMGWRGGSAARFQLALAATLATAFLLGTQAFVNYWLLVATIAMLAFGGALADASSEHVPLADLRAEPVP